MGSSSTIKQEDDMKTKQQVTDNKWIQLKKFKSSHDEQKLASLACYIFMKLPTFKLLIQILIEAKSIDEESARQYSFWLWNQVTWLSINNSLQDLN